MLNCIMVNKRALHIAIDLEEDFCSKDNQGNEETEIAARKAWNLSKGLSKLNIPTARLWFNNATGKEPLFFEAPEPSQDDIIIEKKSSSAASSKDLMDLINNTNVETVIISGVYTSACIISTIQDIRDKLPNIQIFMASDCVAEVPDLELCEEQRTMQIIRTLGVQVNYASRIMDNMHS